MKVLVVIVAYNFCPWIEQCLSSIDNSKYDIMVIDNASTDDTILEIRTHYPYVILETLKQNIGFGQANNMGFSYALKNGYDYVFLLNQDAWILPDTIEKLISVQQQNPAYWVISPMQYNSQRQGLEPQFAIYCKRFGVPMINQNDLHPVEFVNAAVWLVSKKCIETIGGFDPLFPHYGEDTDFLQRVAYYGKQIGIYTGAAAYHEREIMFTLNYAQTLYKTKLVYLNILKNINYPIGITTMFMLGYSLKQIVKSVIKGNFEKVKINMLSVNNCFTQLQVVKQHRGLSKKKGAFL